MHRSQEYFSEALTQYIPEGMTLNGRIEDEVFVPYRIVTSDERGLTMEWTLEDVIDWTICLLEDYPQLKNLIAPANRDSFNVKIEGGLRC